MESLHNVFNPSRNKLVRAAKNSQANGRKKKRRKKNCKSSNGSTGAVSNEKRPMGPFFCFAKVMRSKNLPFMEDLSMAEKSKALGAM